MKTSSLMAALCCVFLVASCGGGGGAGNANVVVAPGTNPPNAPAGVSATVGSGTVTLSWGGVTSANYYNIYYRETTGVTPQNGIRIGNVSPPETISGLTNGATYYFVVTAVNAGGEGSASSELAVTPELQRTRIVGGIYATPGDGEATIEWVSQVDASSYNLYWWTDQPNQKVQIPDVTSPYTMGGLDNGTTYSFEVAAANSLGEGQHSPGTHATPVDPATGWTPQVRISDRLFQQSGGQSEGVSLSLRDMSSNDTGVVAVAGSVCGGRCSIRSVVVYHNAEGAWTGPVNVETGVGTLRPSVIVTPAGHVLIAYERDGRGIYARSYRNGVWEDPVRIDSRGFQYFRAWVDLASDDAGNIFAVWMEAIDLIPNDRDSQVQQAWASRYEAATDSWSTPTMLVESVRGVQQIHVDAAADNQAIAVWLQDTQAFDANLLDGGPEQRVVYASRFDGSDWSAAAPVGSSTFIGEDTAWEVALDANDAGSALVTSMLRRHPASGGVDRQVEAIRFDASSEQWEAPVVLYDHWVNVVWPVAHIDDSDHALAAWGGFALSGSEYDPLTTSWGTAGPIVDVGASGDAHVDTDDSGRSVAFWGEQNGVDGIHTSSSQDGRASWAPINLLGAHADAYVVSVSPNGQVVVAASSRRIANDGVYWGYESALFISTYTPPP